MFYKRPCRTTEYIDDRLKHEITSGRVCSVSDLVDVLSSCDLRVCDVDNTNGDESDDIVSAELVSPHQVYV